MTERVKLLIWSTAIWAVFIATLIVCWYDFNNPLDFSGPMLIALCLIAGALLSVFWLITAWKDRVWRAPAVALLLMGVLTYGFLTESERLGLYAKFYLNKWSYESKVAEIIQLSGNKSVSEINDQLKACYVDPGPPIRVAFVWDGIIDNWYGPVYDPSGKVLEANKFKSNWDDPSLAGIKKLFGGDMVGCRHLTGPWYFCSFT
jgi:energy-coupling factor transporter transmembrane protein EcfT